MSDLPPRIHTILLPGFVLTLIALLLTRLAALCDLNAWSLGYMSSFLGNSSSKAAISTPPVRHSRAGLWLARTALEAGDSDAALDLVNLDAFETDRLSMRLVGWAYHSQGDFHNAVAIWERIGDIESLRVVASKAKEELDRNNALMAYQAIWSLEPESGTLPLANFLLDRMQDFDTAEDVLRQSLADFPTSLYWPTWSRRLGDALQAMECWDGAVIAYEQGVARRPDDWAAHIGLGWVRYERGDGVEAAMTEFQEAIAVNENHGNGYYAIGQVLSREGRYAEADAWFTQALTRNPETKWWYMSRADAARKAGNMMLALSVYEEAISRFPDFIHAHFEVGKTYEEIGDFDKALEAYRATLAIDPEHAGAARRITCLEGTN